MTVNRRPEGLSAGAAASTEAKSFSVSRRGRRTPQRATTHPENRVKGCTQLFRDFLHVRDRSKATVFGVPTYGGGWLGSGREGR